MNLGSLHDNKREGVNASSSLLREGVSRAEARRLSQSHQTIYNWLCEDESSPAHGRGSKLVRHCHYRAEGSSASSELVGGCSSFLAVAVGPVRELRAPIDDEGAVGTGLSRLRRSAQGDAGRLSAEAIDIPRREDGTAQ